MARNFGLNVAMLGRWCREAKQRGSKAFPGTGTPHDQELASLKHELARSPGSGMFYKRRQRSSPRPRDEGCHHSTWSPHVSCASDVSPVEGLPQWELCLAAPSSECLGARLSTADPGHLYSSCGECWRVWKLQDLAAAAPTRRRVWQTSHCPVDAAGGLAGYSRPQALEAAEIGSTTGWDHQSTRPRLYRVYS